MKESSLANRLIETIRSRGYRKKDGTANVNKFAVSKGFSVQSVRNWTGGIEPRLPEFFRLCDALEIDPRWLAIGEYEEGKEQQSTRAG